MIDGDDPFVAVNASALVAGGPQAFGSRQNAYVFLQRVEPPTYVHLFTNFRFFASYSATGYFTYSMGNFAQKALPRVDSVTLTVQRVGHLDIENVTVSLLAFSHTYNHQ